MKTFKPSLLVLIFLIFLSFKTKAQDDLSGVYIDNVKVTELSCFSFGTMTFVFPYLDVVNSYERYVLQVYVPKANAKLTSGSSYFITKPKLMSSVKGKFIVIEFFQPKSQEPALPDYNGKSGGGYNSTYANDDLGYVGYDFSRGVLAYGKGKDLPDMPLLINLYGENIGGYEEKYDQGCQCIKKTPNYASVLIGEIQITLKGREINKKMLSTEPFYREVDFSQPCNVPGTKVDFNNLGKSGGSSTSNSNSNSTSTNNTPVKTETPVKTSGTIGKTIITTVAPTSATAVKPLDKTKPGYFEEKSDDKKFMYRNGYQTSPGTYHGEVREYDNNTLEKIITYSNGVEDGLYVIFSDGKVEWAGTYKNGKKDGAWKHYKSGTLEETEKYINGEKQD